MSNVSLSINVSKFEIEKKIKDGILHEVNKFEANLGTNVDISLFCDQYENDPREMWNIPEVVEFCDTIAKDLNIFKRICLEDTSMSWIWLSLYKKKLGKLNSDLSSDVINPVNVLKVYYYYMNIHLNSKKMSEEEGEKLSNSFTKFLTNMFQSVQ